MSMTMRRDPSRRETRYENREEECEELTTREPSKGTMDSSLVDNPINSYRQRL